MASLKLILTDAAGGDLNDHVTIHLFSQHSSAQFQVSRFIQRELTVSNIDISTGPTFRVMVTPANHRIIQFFIMLNEGATVSYTAPVPVDPAKVVSISGPAFDNLSAATQGMMDNAEIPRFLDSSGGFVTGSGLYTALDKVPLLKACFLNIAAKSAATLLQDKTCLDYYRGLLRMEQDRLFIRTSAALLEETAHANNNFHPVSDALHEPLPGYTKAGSYKTFDHYGNLQLTFQRKGSTGHDYVVDVDIDDAQGIEHIFQVIGNITGPTNPYSIHDILLQQPIPVNPKYDFVFAAAAAVA